MAPFLVYLEVEFVPKIVVTMYLFPILFRCLVEDDWSILPFAVVDDLLGKIPKDLAVLLNCKIIEHFGISLQKSIMPQVLPFSGEPHVQQPWY